MSKENNELIAKFLGYVQPHPDYPKTTYWYKENEQPLAFLLFDDDWNWLMEIIEKIKSVCEEPEEIDSLKDALWWNEKSVVYEECLNFIKTYNLKN